MRYFTLKRFGMLLMLVFAVGLLVFITTHAQARSPVAGNPSGSPASPDWSLANIAASPPQAIATPPPASEDPCLNCHILGSNTGLWTPLARWTLFGSLGLLFVFGVYRSASTWVNRSPWKPLTNRAVEWVDERYKISEPLTKILNKPVPKYALHWWYCLGGITAFLFVVQGLTGILLAFYYKPTPEAAYASIQYIESQVYLGSAIRAIHHWCANGMIVMCVAHMLRVFIMGAYKRPRELNWMSGVFLLILTLVFGFTGYLLPWDQRAFWATTVGSEIAGGIPAIGNLALVFLRVGWNVTGETLSRFYGLHIIIVPLATVAFMGAHFLMIRRQGVAKPL
jgi:quinol-cytochrome oxidoreductase complex cytochrome b subunit